MKTLAEVRPVFASIIAKYCKVDEMKRSCADRAEALLALLPDESMPPKVAPDGDGAVAFFWRTDATLIAVVDDEGVCIVAQAGSPQAVMHEGLSLIDGAQVIRAALNLATGDGLTSEAAEGTPASNAPSEQNPSGLEA